MSTAIANNAVNEGVISVKAKAFPVRGPIAFSVKVFLLVMILISVMCAFVDQSTPVGNLVCYLVPTVFVCLLMKKRFGEGFVMGCQTAGAGKAVLLMLPLLAMADIMAIYNLINHGGIAINTTAALMTALSSAVTAGVFEEAIFRGVICNAMISSWVDKKDGIYKSAILSASFFGLIHLMNAYYTGFTLGLMSQVIFAASIGIVFAAVYLRTRNLAVLMVIHTLWDVAALLFTSNAADEKEMLVQAVNSTSWNTLLMDAAPAILFLAVGLYLMRPARHEEIKALWR